jgi:hypothetical protein
LVSPRRKVSNGLERLVMVRSKVAMAWAARRNVMPPSPKTEAKAAV